MDTLDLPSWTLLKSSRDGQAAITEVSPLFHLFKTRPETELNGLLSQLFPHILVEVDGVFIPSRANPDYSSKMWHALLVIQALSYTIKRQVALTVRTPAPIAPPWSHLLDSIAREWPNIWCWLQFLYSLCPQRRRSSLTSEHRNLIVVTILEFLTLCFAVPAYQHPLQDLVVLEGLSLVAKIWYLQAEEPSFRTGGSSPMGLYLGMTLHLKGDARRAGEHLLDWTGKDAKAVAAAALAQLHRYSPNQNIGLDHVSYATLLLDFLDTNVHIANALLAQNSIRVITRVFFHATYTPMGSQPIALVTSIMQASCKYLSDTLERMDGISNVKRALEAGLLTALLKANIWLDHIGDFRQLLDILTRVLPKYLVYLSVLRIVGLELRKTKRLRLEDRMQKTGPIWNAWTAFIRLVEYRIYIANTSKYSPRRICNNKLCNRLDWKDSFPRCAGCLEGCYCSRDCQVVDWASNHRNRCKRIQICRSKGTVVEVTDEDRGFSFNVLDLGQFVDEFISTWKSSNSRQPEEQPLLSIDLRTLPSRMTVGSADFDRFPVLCDGPMMVDRKECMRVETYLPNGPYTETSHWLLYPTADATPHQIPLEKLFKAMKEGNVATIGWSPSWNLGGLASYVRVY